MSTTNTNSTTRPCFEQLQNALTTTESIVDGYRSLLFELQQDVGPLASLSPLEPGKLVEATDGLKKEVQDIKGNMMSKE